jgi:hypothetical protein
MRGQSQRSSNRVWLGLAILAAAGIGGLTAGLNARAAFGTASSTTVVAEMPASDIVSLRFPADFEVADSEPAPRTLAYASADSSILFSPKPTYALADARSVAANLSPASTSLAAAPPVAEPLPRPKPAAQVAAPAPAAAAAAPAQPKMVLASASTKPVVAAAPKPARKSNAVLNESQLASIKKRLNLTPDQERYWPAVEAELRKMEYSKKSPQGGSRMASIDTSKMDVEGLKSAGFPLVMSFSDDQRRELKSLAHLLGLESVMAGL